MGIASKIGVLVSATYAGFDKAKGYFDKLKNSALGAGVETVLGKDTIAAGAKGVSKAQRDIQAYTKNMSNLRRTAINTGQAVNYVFVKALAGVGAYFGLDKLVSGMGEFYKSLLDSQRVAAGLGMTLTTLSVFTSGFKEIGIDAESTTKALIKMQQIVQSARFGNITSQKLLGDLHQGEYANFDAIGAAKIVGKHGEVFVRGIEQDFMELRSQALSLTSVNKRAALALSVLGDEALNVANAFVDDRELLQHGMVHGQTIYGGKNPLTQFDAKDLDHTLDRVKRSALEFDYAMSQAKVIFLEIGKEVLEYFTVIMHGIRGEMVSKGESLATWVKQGLDWIHEGFVKAVNLMIEIVSTLHQLVVLGKLAYNGLPDGMKHHPAGKGEPFVFEIPRMPEEIAAAYSQIQLGMVNRRKNEGLPENMRAFNLIQESGRIFYATMIQVKQLIDKIKPMIESNMSADERLKQDMKELFLLKGTDKLPKDTFVRQFAKNILDAENAVSMHNLQLPNASRMFSADAESLISRINMEREIKGRDPIERLIVVAAQTKELNERQLQVLESLNRVKYEDLEKLIWK
jgi:hypothetical protein